MGDWYLQIENDDFIEELKMTIKQDEEYGLEVIKEVWTKLKTANEENRKLVEENGRLKSMIQKMETSSSKQKRNHEAFVKEAEEEQAAMVLRIEELEKLSGNRRCRVDNTANMTNQIKSLEIEVKTIAKEKDEVTKEINKLKTMSRKMDDQEKASDYQRDRITKIREEKKYLEKAKKKLNAENRVLKEELKLSSVQRHDCNYQHLTNSSKGVDKKFLEFKKQFNDYF